MADKGELAKIVGADNVFDDPETLERYSKDNSFVTPRKPSMVVKLKDTNEVQEIITLANKTSTPIIANSSGFTKFHGDTIPKLGGVVMDMSGLEGIIRLDRRNRLVSIEPGVTFGQLRSELAKEGMVPYSPLLPRASKSVLASCLEREPIMIPRDHWDVQDPLLAGEIIFGNGTKYMSGGAVMATKDEIRDGKIIPVSPMGAGQMDMMRIIQGSQGSIALLAWASVKCRLKPSLEKPFMVPSQELKDLIPFAQKVLKPFLGDELFILNDFGLANILAEEPEEIRKIRSALPPWILFLNLAGYTRYPEEKIAYQEEQIREIALQEGLSIRSEVGGVSSESVLRVLAETPEKDRRIRYKGGGQDLPLLTTLDKASQITGTMADIAGIHGYPSSDISMYIQPIVQGCGCHLEFALAYDPLDSEESKRVEDLFQAAALQLAHKGASYSRPYGMLSDITYQKDPETVRILREVKKIFDPNDILNPGKLCF